MAGITPRVVMVTRETEYEMLINRHATRGQAEFFLQSRGQSIEEVEQRHVRFDHVLRDMLAAIPGDWRRNQVKRHELDRFLFEPDDLVIAIGQDGLVANVAKYLNGQSVIGVNPDAHLYDGILVPFSSDAAKGLMVPAMHGDVDRQYRTMVQATLDDGQTLYALNELFIGHRSHQSARYRISMNDCDERQSSSGIIVATGTGATGWAKSIHRERGDRLKLPACDDESLAFYVREAFPSVATGTHLTAGLIGANQQLQVHSENNEGGVIFGDGIEQDYLAFNWGTVAYLGVAPKKLAMVKPASPA